MVRTYTPKNLYVPGSKISEAVFLAVQSCYIKGKTAQRASVIVSRWARRKGHKPVSRQAVQSHYARSGEFLWMLAHKERYGRYPEQGMSLEDDLKGFRNFVYWPDRVSDIKSIIAGSRFLQHIIPNPNVLSNDDVVVRLRELSRHTRGLTAKTFYIQWARIWWFVRIGGDNTSLSDGQIRALLMKQLLDAYLAPPSYAPVIDQPERTAYFQYGKVLACIVFDREDNPVSSQRYSSDQRKMINDWKILEDIYLVDTDGIKEMTAQEFKKALRSHGYLLNAV